MKSLLRKIICFGIACTFSSSVFAKKKCTPISKEISKALKIRSAVRRARNEIKGDDLINQYKHAIGKYPLLTKAEEIEIGKAREDLAISLIIALEGDPLLLKALANATLTDTEGTENTHYKSFYDLLLQGKSGLQALEEVSKNVDGTAEFLNGLMFTASHFQGFDAPTKKRLQHLIDRSKELRDELANANLRLVLYFAKRYHSASVSFIDAVGWGNEGLLTAVDHWDYSRGAKFSTYASWWIKQIIIRKLHEFRTIIQMPVYTIGKKYGEELEKRKKDPRKAIRASIQKDAIERSKLVMNIDAPRPNARGAEDKTIAGNMEDESSPSSSARIEQVELLGNLRELLPLILTDIEHEIISYRFGFDGGEPKTAIETARLVGKRTEKVREIEAEAKAKIAKYFFDRGYRNEDFIFFRPPEFDPE